ncbi:MAG: methyl-accepting chemotaxis protein, partial [Candidatus Heimdallarchaeota archaeon]|nr:methyl-accepting chemotaxis protein [Candidatus Heimdallarchaeota archaeon]
MLSDNLPTLLGTTTGVFLIILILIRLIPRLKPLRTFLFLTYAMGVLFMASYMVIEQFVYVEDDNLQASIFYLILSMVGISIFGALNYKRKIADPLFDVITQTNLMADGDLITNKIFSTGSSETSDLIKSNRMLSEKFRSVVSGIKLNAEELASAAEELAAGSEEVAATTEEVTGTIQTIAEGAAEQVKRLEEVSQVLNEMVSVTEESIRQIGITSRITCDLAE